MVLVCKRLSFTKRIIRDKITLSAPSAMQLLLSFGVISRDVIFLLQMTNNNKQQ